MARPRCSGGTSSAAVAAACAVKSAAPAELTIRTASIAPYDETSAAAACPAKYRTSVAVSKARRSNRLVAVARIGAPTQTIAANAVTSSPA